MENMAAKSAQQIVEEFLQGNLVPGTPIAGLAAFILKGLQEGGHMPPVQATQGNMSQREHTAFILRVFQYFVETTPAKQLEVDLRDVLDKTQGRILQVMLDGPTFSARTAPGVLIPTKGKLT